MYTFTPDIFYSSLCLLDFLQKKDWKKYSLLSIFYLVPMMCPDVPLPPHTLEIDGFPD